MNDIITHSYYVYALLRGGEARAVGGVTRRLRGGRDLYRVLYAGLEEEELLPLRGGLVGVKALLRNVERVLPLVDVIECLRAADGRHGGLAHQLLHTGAVGERLIADALQPCAE